MLEFKIRGAFHLHIFVFAATMLGGCVDVYAGATPVFLWTGVGTDKSGAIEDWAAKESGVTLEVTAEAGAVNTSTYVNTFDLLSKVVGSVFSTDVIDALSGVGSLIESITARKDSDTVSLEYKAHVKSVNKGVKIKDIDFSLAYYFVTQRRDGWIMTDIGEASISGNIFVDNIAYPVSFGLNKLTGSASEPTGVDLAAANHIEFSPRTELDFVFSATLNAWEHGGLYDSFGVAALKRWGVTLSYVPEPNSLPLVTWAVLSLIGVRSFKVGSKSKKGLH